MEASDKNAGDKAAKPPVREPVDRQPPAATMPAAGAHAAGHLTNDEATPGSGALTSRSHASGKEVDGGAG